MTMLESIALLAQAEAAPQTVWQLQTHWTWTPWFTVLFVIATVLGIAYLYLRESSPAGVAYRTLLAALRLTSIALVLVMLSELLFAATRSGLPRLVVLLDHSASMGLNQSGNPIAIAGGQPSATSRLDVARELFIENNAALIDKWQQQYEVKFAVVADGVTPVNGETPGELAASLLAVDTQGPATDFSRLGDAVATALDPQQGVLPTAIVLATDGRATAGRSINEARELARRRGVPIYAIGYGATSAPPDARLSNLLADQAAFVGDLVAMGVTLETNGVEGTSAVVRVRDVATDKVVAEQTVNVASIDYAKQIQLVVKPDRQGTVTYAIEVAPIAGERDTANNRLEHTIDVRDDQVRVLLAAGYPNYEFRYLKNLLHRDSSFALTSYLQEADVDYAEQDASAIATLPLDDQSLDSFDVVVLIDLNPRLLPPRWWKNIERHVVEQGGGLALVAGPRYFPWQYSNATALAMLSPVELQSAGRAGGVYHPGFNLQLTPLGSETTAMQLGSAAGESKSIWQGLPPFYWCAAVDNLKPAARALASHPTLRTAAGTPMPLIATQYVGAGRVLYHGVDSTWRWRFRVGDVFFARYWGQSLRQLARSKLLDRSDLAEILVEQRQFDLGQPVRLALRFSRKEQAALDGQLALLVTAEGQPNRHVALSPSRIASGQAQATLSALPPGNYRVTAATAGLQNAPEAVEFTVVAPPGELADATMNKAGLMQLAEVTYGKFYTADTAQNLAADLPTGSRVPLEVLPPVELWNQWWMLAAITGCLTTEWILRKRRAML